ncbi:hypothetical protein RhiirC2_106816 [Rhizophagus irregularis]|uniref:Uncharacterized protein n=1 Tax=Rhizophagus irregularis TaxID=588596 RepID=A0A2N1MRP7_9GLOM|nr:hypothetical protein RhiirC2_106816 [Rhizophagus irregularis]
MTFAGSILYWLNAKVEKYQKCKTCFLSFHTTVQSNWRKSGHVIFRTCFFICRVIAFFYWNLFI